MFSSNTTVDRRVKMNTINWYSWYLLVLCVSAAVGTMMLYASPKPDFIAWVIFTIGVTLIMIQPRFGIYLTLFFSLVGDKSLIYWYPFHLNFSSPESLLYLHYKLIFSPMEIFLVLTLLAWLVRGQVLHQLYFRKTILLWPVVVFLAFVIFGLLHGILSGGDMNVGLWEARPIFYLPLMLVLTTNLITERGHITVVMWLVAVALLLESMIGIIKFLSMSGGSTNLLAAAFMEHSAAVHMNSLFVFLIGLWIFRAPMKSRAAALMIAFPVLFTYLLSQRRSAFFSLLMAFAFLAFILYRENRSVFWIIVPAVVILFGVYLLAFWNNNGLLGFAARAVKSQFAPDQSSMRDQYSDIYRLMENFNIRYTIRQAPLLGIGFGKMFTMILPLPDISFFVWYRYITHNSIGWIWMKTGVGGFIAMLFVIGLAIMVGVRTLYRVRDATIRAIVLSATLYIAMHFIYAYVDMSWDNQSMTYIGAMLGIIGIAETVSSPRSDQNRSANMLKK